MQRLWGEKKSSNRYRKIVKRSWRKYVLTRWTKTSDRTDRIIDPFPGMDEKTSCSVLSRKGTGVWNRVFNKRGKIFNHLFRFAIMAAYLLGRLKINVKWLISFLLKNSNCLLTRHFSPTVVANRGLFPTFMYLLWNLRFHS